LNLRGKGDYRLYYFGELAQIAGQGQTDVRSVALIASRSRIKRYSRAGDPSAVTVL
jgi:hypothetical protein